MVEKKFDELQGAAQARERQKVARLSNGEGGDCRVTRQRVRNVKKAQAAALAKMRRTSAALAAQEN